MHPAIGVGQLRVCTTDTDLAGQMMLPAGTVLWMPHHAIQNSRLNWDKPDSFLPGQWQLCALLDNLADARSQQPEEAL